MFIHRLVSVMIKKDIDNIDESQYFFAKFIVLYNFIKMKLGNFLLIL